MIDETPVEFICGKCREPLNVSARHHKGGKQEAVLHHREAGKDHRPVPLVTSPRDFRGIKMVSPEADYIIGYKGDDASDAELLEIDGIEFEFPVNSPATYRKQNRALFAIEVQAKKLRDHQDAKWRRGDYGLKED